MKSTRHPRFLLPCLLLAASACGGGTAASGAFSATFPDNRSEDVASVLARLASAPSAESPAIAVGLTSTPSLFAYDIASGHELWTSPVGAPVSAPRLAGELVLLHESTGIVARGLRDGRTRFTIPDSAMHLVGADGEGPVSVFVLSTGAGVGARSEVVVAQGGSVSWRRSYEQALGAPAVAGGLVFLPWATQNLSVLDARTGDELARLRSTDAVVSEARRFAGHVYYGRSGFYLLDAQAAGGSRESTHFASPRVGDLPGDPSLDADPYRPAPPATSAVHKIRLAWRPSTSGTGVGVQDALAYFVFYRLVFALEADGGALRWVSSLPADGLDSVASEGGLWVATADGQLRFLDAADGRERPARETGHASVAMALPHDLGAPDGAAQGEALPLAEQLLAAAQNTDARLVPARSLAVARLAAMSDGAATESLLSLCDDRRLPPPVRAAACEGLAARSNGAEFVLTALRRHANFLDQTEPPPAGPLGRASANMHLTAAVPLLLGQLREPATPAADLAGLAQALGELGDRSAAEPLLDFVRLYHADAADDPTRNAVAAASQAVARLLGVASVDELTTVAADPLCSPGVAQALRDVITSLTENPAEATDAPSADANPTDDANANANAEDATPAPQLPVQVTDAMVTRVLAPVEAQLRACLSADSTHPPSARLMLVLEGDGAVRMVSTTPGSLQSCIEPLVRAQTFPGNRADSRQQVTHTLRRAH